MRSLLCREFVKGIFENAAVTGLRSAEEESKLMQYQMFLNTSSQREELTFSFFGPGSISSPSVLVGQGTWTAPKVPKYLLIAAIRSTYISFRF